MNTRTFGGISECSERVSHVDPWSEEQGTASAKYLGSSGMSNETSVAGTE